jgi:cell division protein FtsL
MARAAAARSSAARKAPARSSTSRKSPARSSTSRKSPAHAGSTRGRRSASAAPARRKPTRRSTAGHARAASPARARQAPRGGAAPLPLPVRVLRAPAARAIRARASGVLDALLQGQGWIALVGVLLAGIVFFNVYLLQLNRDIAATSQRAAAVKRENARLRLDVARLGSSERIQLAAAEQGLVLPAPGEVRYLRANPAVDGRRAAKRVEPPELAEAPVPVAPEPVAPDLAAQPLTTAPAGQAPAAGAQTTPAPADPAAPTGTTAPAGTTAPTGATTPTDTTAAPAG